MPKMLSKLGEWADTKIFKLMRVSFKIAPWEEPFTFFKSCVFNLKYIVTFNVKKHLNQRDCFPPNILILKKNITLTLQVPSKDVIKRRIIFLKRLSNVKTIESKLFVFSPNNKRPTKLVWWPQQTCEIIVGGQTNRN